MNPATSPSLSSVFLERVYTKNQAIKALRTIKDFINFKSYSQSSTSDFSSLLEGFQKYYLDKISSQELNQKLNILNQFGEEFFKLFDPTSLSEQLTQIEKSLESTKTVTIHIPFEMPESEVEKTGIWFKANLGKEAIFELLFDASLIGGCTLSYKGLEKDYSIRQKIKDNKSRIIETLAEFKK